MGLPKDNTQVPIILVVPPDWLDRFYPGFALMHRGGKVRCHSQLALPSWGHNLTLKAPVLGSISQREKSVSRSPLLSIFRYPVTPRGMKDDGCVLRVKVQGLQTSSPSFDLVCLALRIHTHTHTHTHTHNKRDRHVISRNDWRWALKKTSNDTNEMGKKA